MTDPAAAEPTAITVEHQPIHLCALLKVANLVQSGGEAMREIVARKVRVNGEIETRKRRKIRTGDLVEYGGTMLRVR